MKAVVCTGATEEAANLAALPYAQMPGARYIEGPVKEFEFRNGAGVVADMDHLRAKIAGGYIYVVMVLYNDD